mmetsp:Transcript_27755/g.70759  ORF Transcript_27755/g.70759 Transcript_27755/m.70759 type:complete len:905 (-) Transcript_27755:229-2943(-)
MHRQVLLAGLLACLAVSTLAFKEHEFKKCKDAGFCRRHRGKTGTKFSVDPASVNVHGATLNAKLLNADASGKSFDLSLLAYDDGFVRLKIEEPGANRYQISDITNPKVEERKTTWAVSQKDAKSTSLTVGNASVVLGHQPFRLTISMNGKPAVTLNSRDMFNFEHRRTKEEPDGQDCDGCWEETFLGHTDSKPKGPEAMSLDLSFPGFDHVYGLPERATSLALKPTPADTEPYRLYNLDVFEYLHESPFGLYGSIPLMVAHKLGLTTGVFWLNAAEMFVDVAKEKEGTATQWIAESGVVDLFVFLGPSPQEVVAQYSALTGTTALPQLFSIGYHQCRWNYKDEADVKVVDSGFDSHAIPYDVLWLDIEHTNGKRYLTWDSHLFPNPVEMQNDVASRGRKMVTIVDPHVKRDHGYYVFSQAEQAKHFVRNKNGGDFDGWCWPGSSSYLDVTSPVVREWWAEQFDVSKYQGSTQHLYIWNDMNEPSVFNGPEITMQKDVLHAGDVEHREVHNLYGLYYHQGTAEGLAKRGYAVHGSDGDRPFVLSRAFFAGTQRVGPIWTGDNAADWNHLRVSVPMLLTLGVTGLPFSGADVGGFFGNPDPELLTRWYQLGTFYPFFRGHAHLETQRREPWLSGEPHTTRIRDAIRERYALLPYMYTLFRHSNVSGDAVLRPLWYDFPENKDTFAIDDALMLGPSILVRPVLSAGATSVEVVLPRTSRWYDMLTGVEMEKSTWLPGLDQSYKVTVTPDSIPAYYRGGRIVPRRERPRRSSATQAKDPITLVIALDHNGNAEGDLYLDDGRSFAFMRGQYAHRAFSYAHNKLTSTAAPQAAGTPKGELPLEGLRIERVVFLGLPKKGAFKAKLPGGQTVPLEAGPLSQRAPKDANALVLRAPDLPVTGDWVVEIIKA